jgi:tellurite resistance protein
MQPGHNHPIDTQALVEAMVLAAAADGDVSKVELEALYARAAALPETSRLDSAHLRLAIAEAARKMAGLPVGLVVQSLVERLPSHRARAEAFAGAAWVAIADRHTRPSEMALLKEMQQAFALDDATVALLFESAELGAERLAETLRTL